MKKLVVEVKIIAYGVVHHVAKAFFDLQVLLPANMTKLSLQGGPAIQAVIFFAVMFLHLA